MTPGFSFDVRPEDTLWERLRRETRPIVLYGTGNGADKIIDQLAQIGRTPDGVFASSGFVRTRTFRDMPVESYEDVTARLGEDIVILIAFGSALPDVIGRMRELEARHTVYIPEVPLIGGEVFTYDYYARHREELAQVFARLSDDTSRDLFYDMLRYRLGGRLSDLDRTEDSGTSLSALVRTEEICTALDGGAFTGDSARVMLTVCPHLEKLLAVEPDERTFKKLSAFAETTSGVVIPVHGALWDAEETLTYSASASRGAGINGNNRRARTANVPAMTAESLCAGISPDLIKLDVEGAEMRALRGAESVILRDQCTLAVSLYHRTEDLFALPLYLAALCPDYRFYLRRVPCVPAWDLMLYAVPPHLCRN
ncbi:MAG: FkbM family methyltransferase [Clostridia bacterium]|nr:FkbM family methyltransferase [Clostridia bacterium]